jgi:succinoglycan biosynthesis protein ExoA
VDVSVLVPVLNERAHIRDAVATMGAQRGAGEVELIFVDGGSDDGTPAILAELAAADPRVVLLENPHRRTPQALNIALRAARGDYVARMDAHTHYPPDYLARGVERLRRGDVAWVSGPQLARGTDTWSERVALALSTPLGSGGAAFRRAGAQEIDVDTGFTGVWARETLLRHGGWDEGWPVDQDFELAARIRAEGGRIVCVPEMAADYIPRNDLRRLWRQYFGYGVYRVKTSHRHPTSMRRSHVLPPGVAAAAVLAVAAPRPLRRLARAGIALYALVLLGAGGWAARDGAPPRDAAAVPAVLATMHLAAGAGFLRGCLAYGPPLRALAALVRRR